MFMRKHIAFKCTLWRKNGIKIVQGIGSEEGGIRVC